MIQGIKGIISKNVTCQLDEMTVIDTSDGFYSHHFEQWNLVSREANKYIGFVTIEECIPEVTQNGEKYDMLVTVIPFNNDKIQGFDHLNKPTSRVEVLKKAIEFLENN